MLSYIFIYEMRELCVYILNLHLMQEIKLYMRSFDMYALLTTTLFYNIINSLEIINITHMLQC